MTTLTTRLEETIRENMSRSRVAGLAIALVKDGELLAAEGYGVTNVETGEKVAPDTRFSIMSVTKTIVATAIMQLHDIGLLPLDDAVNHYLAPAHIANEWEAESPVTTRQLLTHTGGLPVQIAPFGKMPLAKVVSTARTTYRPGTDMLYANIGYDAAGVLIENLDGEPVDKYLYDAIFKPLGMTASALRNPEEGEPRAYGHYRSALDEELRILPLPDWATIPASPAGGVWSNVLDLSKFLVAHLTGGAGILSPDSISEMHRVHARLGNSDGGQGIGFRVTRVNGRHTILHGGDGSGFTAFLAAHPDEGVAVVMLMNTGGVQAARSIIGTTALATLVPPERRTIAVGATIPDGVFKSTYWDIELESRSGDSLTATRGLVLSEGVTQSKLQPTGDATFEGEGGMFHGFEVDPEGERIYGGLYPFTFVRATDLPGPPAPIDETIDLSGDWTGFVQTPLGPIKTTLNITSETALTVSTPFAQGVSVENARARAGRVEGEFTIMSPVGEMRLFLRLEARGGKLTGDTYGRSDFGETPFATELERA